MLMSFFTPRKTIYEEGEVDDEHNPLRPGVEDLDNVKKNSFPNFEDVAASKKKNDLKR